MQKVRIAVAGAGLIGLRHIEETQKSAGCELAAIVDPSPRAAEVAEKAGVPLYKSLDELFAKAKPDGVVLATPNQLHVGQALECVRAGVPALVEKPVAHDLAEGERLCQAAEGANVKLLVGHHRRHSPILHRAVEIVRSGVLGRIVAVIGSALFYKPDHYFDEAPWRRQPGGGPILLNMIHEVGNLRAMVGEIVAVQAFASTAVRGFPVEDTVAINLRFANDALGTFLLSDTAASAKSWEQTSQENASYPTYPDEDCYTIAGTDGSLSVPTMRLKTYAAKAGRSWWKPFQTSVAPLERADPLARQIEHFGAVIRGEAEPLVTARDGLQNLRVTEAIVEAARTGRIVETA
jgi:predicted dehydrogenase